MESYLKSQQRINSPKFRSKDKICLVNAEVENSLDLQIVEFEQAMHDLRRDIYRISSNIGQISRLCGQLGGPEDSHDLRSRLNATMEITKNAIKALNDKIQAIIPRCSSIPEDKRGHLRLLVREFHQVVGKFQSLQELAVKKTKAFISQAQILAQETNIAMPAHEAEQEPLFGQQQQELKRKSESLANEISYNQAILIEREHGIQQMQATMMEINEIFKDIDVIVGEQGDFVDSIEAHMEAAASRTRNAGDQLRIAEDYRRRRPYQCWHIFIAVLLTVILISVIISL